MQNAGQLLGIDGLENVFRHIHLQRLLDVVKGIEAGKHHEFGGGQPLGQDAAQLQPVHKGHFDIGENQIGAQAFRQLQGVLSVGRLPYQRKAQLVPFHFLADADPDILLVIHQQHPIQLHRSLHPLFPGILTDLQ